MKNVLITGATTGIGLSIAKKFLDNGFNVISVTRNESKVSYFNQNIKYYFGDVASVDELQSIYDEISCNNESIDVLVNNAGIIIPGGIESLSYDDWKNSLNINLSGYYNTTKMFLPLLKNGCNPNIVNISSISAKLGGSSIAYSVAKAGVDMMTKVLARELFKYGIRVNAISPGVVNSGFQVANNVVPKENYEEFLSNLSSAYPFGIGDVSEISNAVFFLSSNEAKWITGSNLTVDGGKSINI